MHVSEIAAREMLDRSLLPFAKGIELGDEQVKDDQHLSPEVRSMLRPSAIAHVRQCVVVAHMRQLINPSTDPDVWWDSPGGLELLHIRDVAVCRFKQLDRNLLSSNIETGQAQLFEDQDVPMPGMPPEVARFTVGWQVDEFGRSVQSRYVVQPNNGHSPRWFISLDEIAAGGAQPVTFTRPSTDPMASGSAQRVQAKGTQLGGFRGGSIRQS